MPQFNFKEWLEGLDVEEKTTDQYTESVDCLRGVTEAMQERLNEGFPENRILIELIPGLQTNMGQQFNVKLRVPKRRFQDGLFRAYIPVEGLPVTLDLYGDDLVPCHDLDEMQQQIAHFLKEIEPRLAQYRTFARG